MTFETLEWKARAVAAYRAWQEEERVANERWEAEGAAQAKATFLTRLKAQFGFEWDGCRVTSMRSYENGPVTVNVVIDGVAWTGRTNRGGDILEFGPCIQETCSRCGRPAMSETLRMWEDVGRFLVEHDYGYHQCRPGWTESEDGELVPPGGALGAERTEKAMTPEEMLLSGLKDLVWSFMDRDDG